jgi:monofunctional biosynthetic peptidoglycan transglycosylase
MRPIVRRLRRLVIIASIVFVVGPFLLALPLNLVQPFTTAVMLARTGERLVHGKRPIYPNRDIVAHNQISPFLHRAVLASEDDRFFIHEGFDFEEIEKAIENSKRGKKLRGASTITQQVAKNLFLWEGRSFVRKGLEAWLTVVLELCLSKERILDLYLNMAEWGDGIFGAEMAAQTYYHKSAAQLTREEAARLAAILPSPRRWSPSGSVATRRAALIMERMQYAAPHEADEPTARPPKPRGLS